jgi:hypothetical protein
MENKNLIWIKLTKIDKRWWENIIRPKQKTVEFERQLIDFLNFIKRLKKNLNYLKKIRKTEISH